MHDELRDALRRVDPPAGFAGRVMERGRAREHHASPFLRWALAASLVAAIGGAWYRAEERRREGEEARRQVLVSLNIAGSKLRAVQMKINHEQER